jgi:hypothetical protein
MRGTIFIGSIVLMASGIAVSVPATAQSVPDVQHALSALRPRVQQLNAAGTILDQMERVMRGAPEFDVIAEIISARFDFVGSLGEAHTTALIFINMTCPDDVRFVRGAMRESAHSLVNVADIRIEEINVDLALLTTPAVVAEATKIRDLIIEIRDILKPFAGRE